MPLPPTPFDPFGEALHSLRMKGVFYCRSELTAPWGLEMPPMDGCIWFHVVASGRCQLTGEGVASVDLLPGDLALVPHGHGHFLRSDSEVETPLVTQLPQEMVGPRYSLLSHGGDGAPTTLICGVAELEHPLAHDLVGLLPAVLHLDGAGSAHGEWIASTLRLMAAEAKQLRPGGETVITRLADILVIQTLRTWLENNDGLGTGWVSALRDAQVGRAIRRVHREPALDWTVASLAAEAGMSRSGFSARFRDLVDEPPMQYVTRVRMRFAHRLLKEEKSTLGDLAIRLGYRSEAAFSRAFKRVVGISPGAARRSTAALPD